MSISLPAIFSLSDESKNTFLFILVKLTMLPIDVLFYIFGILELKTILSLHQLCPYFITIFNDPITLKWLQRKARDETRFNTSDNNLDYLIKLSRFDFTFDVDLWKEYLMIIKCNNKLGFCDISVNGHWDKLPILPNNFEQISVGNYPLALNNQGIMYYMDPENLTWVPDSSPESFVKISCVEYSQFALTKYGEVKGIMSGYPVIPFIKYDLPISGIIDISSGSSHSMFLNNNGDVYSLGNNNLGQLGRDTDEISFIELIPNLSNVIKISCGSEHSLVLTKDRLVYSFGSNHQGQLGLKTLQMIQYPTLIPDLKDIIQISAGSHHTLALRIDGKVYGFGSNNKGQLGFSGIRTIKVPTLIANIDNVRGICSKSEKSFFFMENGNIMQMINNKLILRKSIY
jgi:hypothetical protein